MSFGTDASGERAKPKAWKEIWGSGQGVGSISKVVPAAELIGRFKKKYDDAVDPALALKRGDQDEPPRFAFCLSMISSENRSTLFRIML